MHGQEGEGEEKDGFLKKECVTHKMCHRGKSCSLGFPVPQFVPHDHIHGQEGDRRQRKTPTKRESVQLCVGEKLEPRISAASICASSSSEVHATKKSSHGSPLVVMVVNGHISLEMLPSTAISIQGHLLQISYNWTRGHLLSTYAPRGRGPKSVRSKWGCGNLLVQIWPKGGVQKAGKSAYVLNGWLPMFTLVLSQLSCYGSKRALLTLEMLFHSCCKLSLWNFENWRKFKAKVGSRGC